MHSLIIFHYFQTWSVRKLLARFLPSKSESPSVLRVSLWTHIVVLPHLKYEWLQKAKCALTKEFCWSSSSFFSRTVGLIFSIKGLIDIFQLSKIILGKNLKLRYKHWNCDGLRNLKVALSNNFSQFLYNIFCKIGIIRFCFNVSLDRFCLWKNIGHWSLEFFHSFVTVTGGKNENCNRKFFKQIRNRTLLTSGKSTELLASRRLSSVFSRMNSFVSFSFMLLSFKHC